MALPRTAVKIHESASRVDEQGCISGGKLVLHMQALHLGPDSKQLAVLAAGLLMLVPLEVSQSTTQAQYAQKQMVGLPE